MNDVHTLVARKLRSAAAALRADAAASNFVNLRDLLLVEIVELEKRADSIEEQVTPTEPTEWGSVVRASFPDSDGDRVLLAYVPNPHESDPDKPQGFPWYSERDAWCTWGDLSDVEVLRVGVGPQPLVEWESDLLNFQYRRDTAAAVLTAMDVDQCLIDAVVNAKPDA